MEIKVISRIVVVVHERNASIECYDMSIKKRMKLDRTDFATDAKDFISGIKSVKSSFRAFKVVMSGGKSK